MLLCHSRPDFPYLKNFFFCKSMIVMFLSMLFASFLDHISTIVCSCSNPKMARTYTQAVITMMQNAWFFFWNFPKMDNPTDSLRTCDDSFVPTIDSSITILISSRCPNPTWTQLWAMWRNWSILINLCPKPINNCRGETLGLQKLRRAVLFIHSSVLAARLCLSDGRAASFLYPTTFRRST